MTSPDGRGGENAPAGQPAGTEKRREAAAGTQTAGRQRLRNAETAAPVPLSMDPGTRAPTRRQPERCGPAPRLKHPACGQTPVQGGRRPVRADRGRRSPPVGDPGRRRTTPTELTELLTELVRRLDVLAVEEPLVALKALADLRYVIAQVGQDAAYELGARRAVGAGGDCAWLERDRGPHLPQRLLPLAPTGAAAARRRQVGRPFHYG